MWSVGREIREVWGTEEFPLFPDFLWWGCVLGFFCGIGFPGLRSSQRYRGAGRCGVFEPFGVFAIFVGCTCSLFCVFIKERIYRSSGYFRRVGIDRGCGREPPGEGFSFWRFWCFGARSSYCKGF